MVKTYSVLLRTCHGAQQILSLNDIKLTLRALSLAFLVFILSYLIGDAVFLWLLSNAVLMYPLVYKQKRAQVEIDAFISSFNIAFN